jgi:hypothetical protein
MNEEQFITPWFENTINPPKTIREITILADPVKKGEGMSDKKFTPDVIAEQKALVAASPKVAYVGGEFHFLDDLDPFNKQQGAAIAASVIYYPYALDEIEKLREALRLLLSAFEDIMQRTYEVSDPAVLDSWGTNGWSDVKDPWVKAREAVEERKGKE